MLFLIIKKSMKILSLNFKRAVVGFDILFMFDIARIKVDFGIVNGLSAGSLNKGNTITLNPLCKV